MACLILLASRRRAVVFRQAQEEVPVGALLLAQALVDRTMLRALREGFLRSRIGQTSTHRPQPVQSSGATW